MKFFQTIFVILLLAGGALAKDVWFEVDTPNFRVVGDNEKVRDVAAKLEQFHQNFQKLFTKIQLKTPFPTKVIVARIERKFIAADDTNYIAISPDDDFADVFHAYANFLIDNNLGLSKTPAWLNHGLAEYLSKRIGTRELIVSEQLNLSSLQNLLETDYFTLQNQTVLRKALFNAQSFAFVSYLLKDENFERLEKFIELLQIGNDVRSSLTVTFQFDFTSGENEFRQFLQKPKLLQSNDLTPLNLGFAITPLSEAKGLAALGEFLFYSNRLKESVDILAKSLRLEPNLSQALSTLALVKAKGFYYDEAEELAEKALASEPENFLNYYRHALVLSRQGMTEYGFVSGYPRSLVEKMRQSLTRSIELNPIFAESYALLAFVNYVCNEQIVESFKLIQKALSFAPANQRYLLRRAELNLRKENFTEARRDALEVFRAAPSESTKLYAQNTIQRIDSTEFQLARVRGDKTRYVNDDIVTEKPLSDEEIRVLREKAVAEQIRLVLRRPQLKEKRIIASLTRVECGKAGTSFSFKTATGLLRLQARSFEEVNLISFIEGLTGFRLYCGTVGTENYASVIYGGEGNADKLISIEFVPKGFRLPENVELTVRLKGQ